MGGQPNGPWQTWQRHHELPEGVCHSAWMGSVVWAGLVLLSVCCIFLFIICGCLVVVVIFLLSQKRETSQVRCVLQCKMEQSASQNGSTAHVSQPSDRTSQPHTSRHCYHQNSEHLQLIDQYSIFQSSESKRDRQKTPKCPTCSNQTHGHDDGYEMEPSFKGTFKGLPALETNHMHSAADSGGGVTQDQQMVGQAVDEDDGRLGIPATYQDKDGVAHYVVLWEVQRPREPYVPRWEDLPIEVMKLLMLPPHENIVSILGISLGADGQHYLVLERMWASLTDVIHKDQPWMGMPELNVKEVLGIIKGIVAGLKYLHANNVTENHLKPGSILLDEHFHPKIWGLGSTRGRSKSLRYTGHNQCPMSRQAHFFTSGHSQIKKEIHNLGIIMWKIIQVIADDSPRKCTADSGPLEETVCLGSGQFPINRRHPQGLIRLVHGCLNGDTEQLTSLDQIETEICKIERELSPE